jgi:hypothetical protein
MAVSAGTNKSMSGQSVIGAGASGNLQFSMSGISSTGQTSGKSHLCGSKTGTKSSGHGGFSSSLEKDRSNSSMRKRSSAEAFPRRGAASVVCLALRSGLIWTCNPRLVVFAPDPVSTVPMSGILI